MNDAEKTAAKKKVGRWALEAFLPAILISNGITMTDAGLRKLYPHTGEGVLSLVVAFFSVYAAIFYVMARVGSPSSR